MKALLFVGLSVLLSGCISTEHSSDRARSASGNSDGLVCKTEKPTGSHRSTKVCRTVAQRETDRVEAEKTVRRIRTQSQINPG
jgi:hypothetical protein